MESASALQCIPHCKARTCIDRKHISMELESNPISGTAEDPAAAAAAEALIALPQPAAAAAGETALHTMMSIDVNAATSTNRCSCILRLLLCSCPIANECHGRANTPLRSSCL